MSKPAAAPARKSAATASKTTTPAKKSTAAPAKAATRKPVKPAAKPVAKPAADKAVPAVTPVTSVAKPSLKLVRDGFTMPQADFDLIAVLKQRAVALQRPAKKSELLRAGLHVLQALPDEALLAALEALSPIKQGRPKKAH